jgi:hypothetical protein
MPHWYTTTAFELLVPTLFVYPILTEFFKRRHGAAIAKSFLFGGFFLALFIGSLVPVIADDRRLLERDAGGFLILVIPLVSSWIVLSVFHYFQDTFRSTD